MATRSSGPGQGSGVGRKTQVTVYLDAAETEVLDARAARLRISRSAYVSRVIAANLAATVSEMAEQLVRFQCEMSAAALAMQFLLAARDPDTAREVEAKVDEKQGPGTYARLMRELEAEAGINERGDKRRVRRGAGKAPGAARGQEGSEAE